MSLKRHLDLPSRLNQMSDLGGQEALQELFVYVYHAEQSYQHAKAQKRAEAVESLFRKATHAILIHKTVTSDLEDTAIDVLTEIYVVDVPIQPIGFDHLPKPIPLTGKLRVLISQNLYGGDILIRTNLL